MRSQVGARYQTGTMAAWKNVGRLVKHRTVGMARRPSYGAVSSCCAGADFLAMLRFPVSRSRR